MHALDYAAVVAYLLATMVIVYVASRRQSSSEDFFLGGRRMPWLAVGLSIMATLLSTQTYLGAPGEMIRYGPTYVLGFIIYPVVVLIVALFWIPFFMRLRLTNAYDYLELRYNRSARHIASLLFLGLRLGWISMVVFTASLACVAMIGKPLGDLAQQLQVSHPIMPVVLAVGIASTIYACLGGMQAMIWTDVLQAIMLFGGVLLIIGRVMLDDGSGVTAWWELVRANSEKPPEVLLFSTDITVRVTLASTMFATLAWNLCTHCSDQVALQRYFTMDSISSARKGLMVSIGSSMTIGILLAITGLALRYFYLLHAERLPEGVTPESGADTLMPHFYATELPVGFAGLILVSFLCDAMQTLVAGVNSIAAICMRDVFALRGIDRRHEVWVARVVTFVVGIIASYLALQVAAFVLSHNETIFNMMPRVFNMFLGPLASMFITGMFIPRATGRTVIPAVCTTMLFSFLWSWWGQVPGWLSASGWTNLALGWTSILGVDGDGIPKAPTIMLAVGAPCLFGLGLNALLAHFWGSAEHPGQAYTWKQVLLLPAPGGDAPQTDPGPATP